MTVDYKKFYRNCKSKYPFVVHDLAPVSLKTEISISELHGNFIDISGFSHDHLLRNYQDSQLIFIAVVMMISDPHCFQFNVRLPHKVEFQLASLFACNRKKIWYNSKNVKNYYQVYPDFRTKVDHFYSQMKSI
jgi:hypothetical protein